MSDWKHYLVTHVETEKQIVSRIENAAELVSEPAFDYAVREIEAAQKEIVRLKSDNERLQSELKASNDDADRLASELEETYAHNDIYWEEPGESSPALIAHKLRLENKK
jgi:predicted RNase H-like nuclease (RuvC/YqgF family)